MSQTRTTEVYRHFVALSSKKLDILAAFPGVLRQLRTARGESTVALGTVMGVGRSAVERWESGERRPKAAEFFRIAEHYGVTVYQLIGRKPLPKHVELAARSQFKRIRKEARRVVAANEKFTAAVEDLLHAVGKFQGPAGKSSRRKKRQ